MNVRLRKHTDVNIYTCMHACMYSESRVCGFISIYVRTYVCMYCLYALYVCIHAESQENDIKEV